MLLLFQLEKLTDHLFGKELFMRFTARVFRKRFVCVFLYLLVLKMGCRMWLYSFLIIASIFTFC